MNAAEHAPIHRENGNDAKRKPGSTHRLMTMGFTPFSRVSLSRTSYNVRFSTAVGVVSVIPNRGHGGAGILPNAFLQNRLIPSAAETKARSGVLGLERAVGGEGYFAGRLADPGLLGNVQEDSQ